LTSTIPAYRGNYCGISAAAAFAAATGGVGLALFCDDGSKKKGDVKKVVRCGSWREVSELTAAESSKSTTGRVILVTGSAGFVGYHCALALKARGDGVIGIDNYVPYYPTSLKRARAESLMKEGIYTFEGDINERHFIDHILKEYKVTHILALAAQAGVRYAAKDPASYVASNVSGFVNLLEAARHHTPMPRIVYASSSSVYGLNTKTPFSESDMVDNPASLYAATKKANEMIAHTYNHIYGLSFIGLRFFTVYGPWGRPDMAAFSFTKNILKDRPIKIFQGPGGSELERDFTYIDDIVDGCLGAVDRITPSSKATAEYTTYNLGNKDPVTVSYLVDCLEGSLGKKAIRNYVPMPPTGDVLKTSADISKAERDLSYRATTPLNVGIDKFIDWYKEYMAQCGSTKDLDEYVPY
jgi:UDP-glucuronate 4-epimerase